MNKGHDILLWSGHDCGERWMGLSTVHRSTGEGGTLKYS